jgi:hypothetical protein
MKDYGFHFNDHMLTRRDHLNSQYIAVHVSHGRVVVIWQLEN